MSDHSFSSGPELMFQVYFRMNALPFSWLGDLAFYFWFIFSSSGQDLPEATSMATKLYFVPQHCWGVMAACPGSIVTLSGTPMTKGLKAKSLTANLNILGQKGMEVDRHSSTLKIPPNFFYMYKQVHTDTHTQIHTYVYI